MAKQTINLGSGPNTKTGDPLRTAFTKINSNFTELYTTVASNEYIDTTIELDVTATINKIVPTTDHGSSVYHLADGVEGQIMYIVPATGGATSSGYTTMAFDNARWSNGNGVMNEGTDVDWWLPFNSNTDRSSVLTLIFVDGAWVLPHNSFD